MTAPARPWSRPSDEPGIGPVVWGSDETQTQAIRIETRDARFIQEGQAVFRWATSAIAPVAIRAVELAGLSLADIDVLVTHQANLRIVEAIAKKLIAAGARPDLRVAKDIVTSGNTSSASIPIALWIGCGKPATSPPANWSWPSASAPD